MNIHKKTSQKQEHRVAKELNGKVVPASGAMWECKGDVRSDVFLIECKTTNKSFYSLNSATWEKIEKEALKDSLRIPLMYIDICGGKNRCVVYREGTFDSEITKGVTYQFNFNTKTNKSFTLKKEYITQGVKFEICGIRKNMLCCLSVKDFEYYFKEEIDGWVKGYI